jgi:uncharacterized phage protein (TIGR01671 family)
MRELKFRAWDKVSKQFLWPWPEGFDILGETTCFDLLIDQLKQMRPSVLRLDLLNDIEITQYTGLKDKNGKKIYEGDILGGLWGDGYIAWCDKCKAFEYFMGEFGCAACSADVHWVELVEDDGKLEVIGNIYDNPELLEESNK